LWCAAKWPHVGAIRGGVPVCWPWYGRHPSENAWPSHGWARLLDWKLLDSSSDEDGVRLHWQYSCATGKWTCTRTWANAWICT
jgi:D-hexose-6-phosphate mutarotase